jgi:aminoglycoside phosphotransferase (APT) family kinase protein
VTGSINMKIEAYQEAALAYAGNLENLIFTSCSGGLINQSFRVKNKANNTSFFLQQINPKVFSDASLLQDNYWTIFEKSKDLNPTLRIPRPLLFNNGERTHLDSKSRVWRVTEFIEGSKHFETANHEQQLSQAAEAFGLYAKTLAAIDPSHVKPVIPQFHDLHFRWTQFEEAKRGGDINRIHEMKGLLDELVRRQFYVEHFLRMQQCPNHYPIRLLHHDAKMANLLFDESGSIVIAVIDLDTTMPGLFFSDLGDMIRSMACEQGEQCTHWEQLVISPSRYELLVNGYLSSMNDHLTPKEKDSIHYAGLFMLYMQTLRFLSDYLTGDHYYLTERPGQNRDRAFNQFTLLKSLEQLLETKYAFRAG